MLNRLDGLPKPFVSAYILARRAVKLLGVGVLDVAGVLGLCFPGVGLKIPPFIVRYTNYILC